MPAPIARMSLPPRSHSLYMDRAAKVGLVLRLLLPTSLSRRFGGGPTGRLRAVLLSPAVTHISGEYLATEQALGVALVRHGSPEGSSWCLPRNSRPEARTAADGSHESRNEQNDRDKGSEEDGPKKNSTFKPSGLNGNQLADDTRVPGVLCNGLSREHGAHPQALLLCVLTTVRLSD